MTTPHSIPSGGATTRSAWAAYVAAAVLVAGAFLRLHNLDMMEFKGDEQEALNLGMRLLSAHPWSSANPWPSHGMPSSAGIGNAPLFTWIVAAAFAPTRNPLAVAGVIAAVNAVCLYPLWLWARRRMDGTRALLTTAVCAVSPFAVILSRKIWTQDLLLPGVICVLWGVEWLRSGRPWRGIAMLGVAALLVGQLHQSGTIAVSLLPIAIGIQWLADRRHRRWARLGRPSAAEIVAVAAAIGLNLFFWLPYLDYLRHLPARVFEDRPTLPAGLWLLQQAAAQVVPTDLFYFFDPDRDEFLRGTLRSAFYYSAIGLGAPLLVYGVWRWLRSPLTLPVVGIWWWLVILVFAVARIPSYPSYVLTLAPLTAVLAAGAFDGTLPRRWMASGLVAWRVAYVAALLGLTIVTQTWLAGRGGARGDYGIAYRVREAQAKLVVEMVESRTPETFFKLGEARPGEGLLLSCGSGFPAEVQWIVRWLDPEPSPPPETVTLCDDWIPQDDRMVYRWTVR